LWDNLETLLVPVGAKTIYKKGKLFAFKLYNGLVRKNGFTEVIIVVIIALVGVGVAYYLGTQNQNIVKKREASPTPTQTLASSPLPSPGAQSEIPEGWLTYENSEYGFEISYPDTYEALDDEENLYGWPNGIVLLYSGGQAYDIAVEVWDTESEYMDAYSARMDDTTVKEFDEGYITLLDNTQEEDNLEIISTFAFTE
jgi:hypothetical protein